MPEAKALIDPLLEELPLYHAARFEQLYQGDGSGHPIDDFQSLIRNELPFETYMELAEWYESVGCTEEALSLLSCAGNYPVALYKQAYLLHRTGNDDESLRVLQRANEASPEMVFPFRPGSLKALEWPQPCVPTGRSVIIKA